MDFTSASISLAATTFAYTGSSAGEFLRALGGHSSAVKGVAMSADGRRAVPTSGDNAYAGHFSLVEVYELTLRKACAHGTHAPDAATAYVGGQYSHQYEAHLGPCHSFNHGFSPERVALLRLYSRLHINTFGLSGNLGEDMRMDTGSDVVRKLNSETSSQVCTHPFLQSVRRSSASKTAWPEITPDESASIRQPHWHLHLDVKRPNRRCGLGLVPKPGWRK